MPSDLHSMHKEINILIPMAGDGSRFKVAGYTSSKPMIDVFGRPMIELVIQNLQSFKEDVKLNFICCVRRDNSDAIAFLKRNDIGMVLVDSLTSGPASTCLLAKSHIDNSLPLIITNSDQFIFNFKMKEFLNYCNDYDAVIGTFFSKSAKNSYLRLNEKNLVTSVVEKVVISDIATNGLHFWKSGSMFVDSATKMIKDGRCANNGEYYISETFNYLIKDGSRVGVYHFNEHFPIGTPDDLNTFKETFKNANI